MMTVENEQVYYFGELIKELREAKNISQTQLCKGLCTQSHISKIEKGLLSPSAELLYHLATRLGVDLNYFFDATPLCEGEFLKEFQKEVRKLVQDSNYEEVKRMLNSVKSNRAFNTLEMEKFLMWHKGLVAFYGEEDHNTGIELIKKAIEIPSYSLISQKRNIEMILNLANFANDTGDFNKAIEYYESAIKELNHFSVLKDDEVYIRTLFNYSHVLLRTGKYSDAVRYTTLGININVQRNSMYYLGQLYYNQALAYNFMKKITPCEEGFAYAKMIFKLLGLPMLCSHAKSMEKALELNKNGIWEYNDKWIADMKPDEINTIYNEHKRQNLI